MWAKVGEPRRSFSMSVGWRSAEGGGRRGVVVVGSGVGAEEELKCLVLC